MLPENLPSDVSDSLSSLGVSENAQIELKGDWKTFFYPKNSIDAHELLKVARLRPLPFETLEELSKLCAENYLVAKPDLQTAIEEMKVSGIYDETDLTLSELIEAKTDVNILDFSTYLLCDIFQIERPRTYSISSTPNSYEELPECLELTVSRKERELASGKKIVGIFLIIRLRYCKISV